MFSPANGSALVFLLLGLVCLYQSRHAPLGDFGNYYYGSRLFLDGKFSIDDYQSIHYFNEQIAAYGETRFFENYIPVPPFSLLFYAPWAVLGAGKAKLLFNAVSLLVFCVSWSRFLKCVSERSILVYVVPLVFLFPLYSNLLQGQTYLLIIAAILEACLAANAGRVWLAACLLALCISLKLFPAFVLFYFLFRKEYKVLFYTMVCVLVITVITILVVGSNVVLYYLQDVLPRLFSNDIVGTYYSSNQSVYSLLMKLFANDALQNPIPALNLPWLVPALEGCVGAFVLTIFLSLRRSNQFVYLGVTMIASVLVARYNTSYAMVMLLPFTVSIMQYPRRSGFICILLGVLAVVLNIPSGAFASLGLVGHYSRILGLFIVFGLFLWTHRVEWNPKLLFALTAILVGFRCLTFQVNTAHYFEVQNTQGLLYDYRIQKDSITLMSTLGDHTVEETFPLKGSARQDSLLVQEDQVIYYEGHVISDTQDHKLKPFIVNDSLIVCLSDMNQGVGFYKLRYIGIVP